MLQTSSGQVLKELAQKPWPESQSSHSQQFGRGASNILSPYLLGPENCVGHMVHPNVNETATQMIWVFLLIRGIFRGGA